MFRKFLTLMTAMTLLLGSTTPFVAPAAANSKPTVSFDSAAAPNAAIVVNDLGDALGTCAGSGSGACTLRDAITYANATAGADVITFAASGIITLTGTLPPISDTLTLDGTGQIITISGASAYQVMVVNPAQPVTLNSLTIANGYCLSCDGSGLFNNGGTLTVVNSTFSGNNNTTDYGRGGGLFNDGGTLTVVNSTFSGNSTQNGGSGGGLFNNGGTLTIVNSTFSDNSAEAFCYYSCSGGSGGALFNNGGTLTIVNSTFSGNGNLWPSDGGGIDNASGTVSLKNTIVANSPSGTNCSGAITSLGHNLDDGNTCGLNATGDLTTIDPSLGVLANNGGATQTIALQSGSPAINAGDDVGCPAADQRGVGRPQGAHCDIGAYEYQGQLGPTFVVNHLADTDDGNCAPLGQGPGNQDCTLREAINAANTLTGTNTITFSVNGVITLTGTLPAIKGNVLIDGAGQTITVSGASAHQVMVVNSGQHVTLNALTIANGSSLGGGGGLLNFGTLTVTNSTFSGNSSGYSGGGLFNVGTLTVVNSTFSNNSAGYSGGGLFTNYGTLTVVNSTFSGNSAGSGGGGLYNDSGTLTVTNSTFSSNSAGSGGGGLRNMNGSTLNVTNSTFSGNSATGGDGGGIFNYSSTVSLKTTIMANSSAGGNCFGGITSLGHNLDDDNTCGLNAPGDLINTNPLLGPLADNGGDTPTFALQPGSPAIDAGDDADCPATDQRGVARPRGPHCDIGAYESPDYNVHFFLPLVARN